MWRVCGTYLLFFSLSVAVMAGGVFQTMKLNRAASKGDVEKVRELLAEGADPNVRSPNGETPLFFAAWRGELEAVRLLLDAGAEVNALDNTGRSALWIACDFGHAAVAKELIARHANVNRARNDGDSPLMIAAKDGHYEIVKALIEAGAWTSPRNSRGQTAASLAKDDSIRQLLDGEDIPEQAAPQKERLQMVGDGPFIIAIPQGQLSLRKPCPGPVDGLPKADRIFYVDVEALSVEDYSVYGRFKELLAKAVGTVGNACQIHLIRGTKPTILFTMIAPGYGKDSPAAVAVFKPWDSSSKNKLLWRNFVLSQAVRGEFLKKNNVELEPPSGELVGNPFLFQGKVVAVTLTFLTMETEDSGRFAVASGGEVLITEIPVGLLSRSGQQLLLAGRVSGKMAIPGGDIRYTALEYLDSYGCMEEGCSELLSDPLF